MTAITIDKDKAIELLEQQVEKKGADYVYPYNECIYFSDGSQTATDDLSAADCGTPLCILGNVYADLGLTVDDLRVNDTYATGNDNWVHGQEGSIGTGLWDVLPDEDKVILTAEAIKVFSAAQEVQDHRNTWGEAVTAAKEAVA